MNRRFLTTMMAIALGSMVLVGCTTSKENVPANEEIETVVDDSTVDIEDETENEVEEIEVDEEGVETEEEEESIEVDTEVDETEGVYGEVDPSVAQEMLYVITDGIELPARVNMDITMFKDTYGITTNHLSSYVVSTPMMNVHATEIAVFEVVDENGRKAVKEGIEKRVEALKAQWGNYLPEQYELVKNYKVVDNGNFVLFVISEQADVIINKFKTADL